MSQELDIASAAAEVMETVHPSPKSKRGRPYGSKKKVGRPLTKDGTTLYEENPDVYTRRAYLLKKLGKKDAQIAEDFQISMRVFNIWKEKYPALAEALKEGGLEADCDVADALYLRATGKWQQDDIYWSSHKGNVIATPFVRKYPPDVVAALTWLARRQPDVWGEKVQHELGNDENAPPVIVLRISGEELPRARDPALQAKIIDAESEKMPMLAITNEHEKPTESIVAGLTPQEMPQAKNTEEQYDSLLAAVQSIAK